MKITFTNKLIILSISFIIIAITFLTIYNVYFLNNFKDELIKKETSDYIEKEKNIIENKVKTVANNIKTKSFTYENNIKNKLKIKVEEASSYMNKILDTNKSFSKKELKENILSIFKNMNNINEKEYFFIIDLTNKKLLLYNKDDKRFFYNNELKDLDFKEKSIYKNIEFINVSTNKKTSKLLYLKKIQKLNWILGKGIYKEDIKSQVQTLVLKSLKEKKDNNSSYLFIIKLYDKEDFQYFGEVLLHESNIQLEGKKLSYNTSSKKINTYRKSYMEKIRLYGESFIQYDYLKPNGSKEYQKMSFFYLEDGLQWIVASGFYFDDLQKQIKLIKNNINNQIQNYINISLYIAFFASIVISIVFYLLSRKITTTINKYSSDLIESNNELEKQKNVFKSLYEQSSDGIILYDEDSKIINCNSSLLKMLKYKNKDSFLNLSNYEISPLSQKHSECSFEKWDFYIKECLKNKSINFEWLFVKKTYEKIWCDITITKIKLDNQIIIHAVIRDISSKKDLEKKTQKQRIVLAQQSKKSAMGEMIGNIAHQWRQPLNNLSLIMYYLRDNCINLNHKEIDENVENCKIQLSYMSKTIDDFTNYINPNKQKEKFNLQSTFVKIFTIISSQYNDKKIVLNENIDSIEMFSIENELMQVIINILNNARDALKDKEEKLIFMKAYKKNNKVIIKIKDNAGGIKNSIINRIFEPYFTTKKEKEGIGIGLYMVEEMVEKELNGKITVKNVDYEHESKKEKGALFTITLNI